LAARSAVPVGCESGCEPGAPHPPWIGDIITHARDDLLKSVILYVPDAVFAKHNSQMQVAKPLPFGRVVVSGNLRAYFAVKQVPYGL